MDRNTTILTPNRRLSAVLAKQHNEAALKTHSMAWQAPNILPLSSWLHELWGDHAAVTLAQTAKILNSSQEQILWERILLESKEAEFLLELVGTAELARSAWVTLKLWDVSLDDPALQETENSRIFINWAQKYQHYCQQYNWYDLPTLVSTIIEQINLNKIKIPQQIILAGFTEISPLHKRLLHACEQRGCEVKTQAQPKHSENISRISANDEDNEILMMSIWAKQIYESHKEKTNLLIGCVIPSLETMREKVLATFTNTFTKVNQHTMDFIGLPFNISAGKNLSLFPIIHIALKILQTNFNKLTIETISTFLLTPYISGGDTEQFTRAEFDRQMRDANIKEIPAANLASLSLKRLALQQHCPLFITAIENLLDKLIDLSDKKLPSEWVQFFMQCLNAIGWPGERELNSEEYQVVQAWYDLLSEYTSYDAILGKITVKSALHQINRLTTTTIFQPQSPDAPIQILGMLEATEVPFTHLWVMGMDDTNWPPAPQPNPFIPTTLQKKLLMPHATAERELLFTQSLLSQLKGSGEEIIFSHSNSNGQAQLRPSPLIETLPQQTVRDLKIIFPITKEQNILLSSVSEECEDFTATAIDSIEIIKGGTALFKHQAACAFRSFAEIRLNARKIEPVTLGLTPRDRGNIVHRILELIWTELKDQQALINCNNVNELIVRHVSTALRPYIFEKNVQYMKLEQNRLQNLLTNWLELEKRRPYFKVIAIEKATQIKINNVNVNLRIDRIDELSDGSKILIDYKTGINNSINDWLGDDIDEPQLPLYALADPTIVGLIYAQLSIGNLMLKGLAQIDLGISSVKTLDQVIKDGPSSWQAQLEHWQHQLETTALNFIMGDARVNPKVPIQTCRYCNLRSLCRVDS